MCLILFAYKVHPQFPFILAANRDEFYNRPTAAAHFWEDYPFVLGGRDLEKMGTWMGVSKDGKFAALTNYRDPDLPTDGKRTRGELVSTFLIQNLTVDEYSKELQATKDHYPGYNLIFGNKNHLYYYSNVADELKILTPGIYGLSNHLLNTDWPKVTKGKKQLSECIHEGEPIQFDCLFQTLANRSIAPDHLLPNTGVTKEWERTLSPLFIQTNHYGTVSSTILTFSKDKDVTFIEHSFTNGKKSNEECFTYTIDED